MRIISLLAAVAAGIVEADLGTKAAAKYAFYYTDAGDCDPPGNPPCKPSEIPMLNLVEATFDSTGTLLSNNNLTVMLNGLGYLNLHPQGHTMMFATEDTTFDGIVRTWTLDLTTPGALPTILLADLSNLLTPCAPVCVSASTFHATWTADGTKVVFAYRVWDTDGNGIGSQGLAIADADGGGDSVRSLTWTQGGPQGGLLIIDQCPSPVAGDTGRVLFVRTPDQGISNYLTLVDIATGNATMLEELPQWADVSGCPNSLPTADGVTNIVMLCSDECGFAGEPSPVVRSDAGVRWGMRASRGSKAAAVVRRIGHGGKSSDDPFFYATVAQPATTQPGSFVYTSLFPTPLVNTTDYDDTYGITQCDAIRGSESEKIINCQGASMAHDTFQYLFVDEKTGNSSKNSYDTLQICMTARCTVLAQIA